MQEITNLIEDYKLKMSNIEEKLTSQHFIGRNECDYLKTKFHCYETFVVELERATKEIK